MNAPVLDKVSKKRKITFYPDSAEGAPEVKCNDIQFSQLLDAPAMNNYQTALLLNGLGSGLLFNQHVGRQVTPKAMHITACFYLPDNTNGTTQQNPYQNRYRVSVVWDRYPNASAPPGSVRLATNAWVYVGARFYQNQSGVATNLIAQSNPDLRDRVEVLWQDTFDIVVNQRETYYFETKIDLSGFKQTFNSQSTVNIDDIQEGACYFVIQCLRIGSVNAACCRCDLTGRYLFEDN